MIEALKEAKSVIGSINSGKENALTIGGETVFWQREEWVRWALDEVLPLIEQAIAEAEKQEPKPCPTCEALARTVLMDQTGRDA